MSKTVIGASQFGGQGLFANVPFNVVYEQVLCEAPHVCCVTEKALKTTCINCWSRCEKLLRCCQCKNASFCSALCQKESWKMHLHKGECLVAPDRTEDSVRLVLRLLFRGETTRPLGDVAVLLGEAQRLHYAELAAVLVGRLARAGHAKFDENGVAKALFQLHCCAMRISDPSDGSPLACGLFSTASAVSHSCRPNCLAMFDARGTVCLLATRPIAAHEELTLSYVDESLPRLLRRWMLFDTWRIERCDCEACRGPDVELEISPSLLFDLFEALGDSSDGAGPAARARFLTYAGDQGKVDPSLESDARSVCELLRGMAETAGCAPKPGLRFAELGWSAVQKRPNLFPPGSYFWMSAVRRLARHCIKVASTLPEEEMAEMLDKGIASGDVLASKLTRAVDLPVRLGLDAIAARAAMWQASWWAEKRDVAKTRHVMARATRAMEELEKGCNLLFKDQTKPHGLLRDRDVLREQYREMKQALQL